MITIHDLLKDTTYKQFICQQPSLPPHMTRALKPWRLMVQLKGEQHWRMKRFGTYSEAFKAMKKILPRAADATINCPALGFVAPTRVVRIKGKFHTNGQQLTRLVTWKAAMPMGEFEEHHWCPYCRRPSVFKRFRRHHALQGNAIGGLPIDPSLLRCSICGASENIVSLRKKS